MSPMRCLLVNEKCFLKGASSMLSKDNWIYQFENTTMRAEVSRLNGKL